jgi:2,3-bisphosphoglycerate-dependent phosphoglycerate mutase
MATIYLFRHGQTDFNRDQRFTGWLNSRLTGLGRQQARTIAGLLVNKTINLAYQTRLFRSQETLKIVLQSHPECKNIITDDRLIERSYGDLSGETHQEIIDGFGIGQYEQWHRGFYSEPPGGESFADVENRVMTFLADFKKKYGGRKMNVAISAHGNSIRLFRKIMENATIKETVNWVIPYDNYFQYQI